MSMPGPPSHSHSADRSRKWWTLAVVCVGTFMLLLDVTIVNVALPSIQRSLKSSFSDLQWVVDAYALTLAALLLTAGSLADRLGRRLVFLLGLVVFTASSALCGVAGSPLFLNLARGIQGAGGAMMFATSLALLAQEFGTRERGIAFGVWGGTLGSAVAVGPLVGGVLTQGLGWQSIFYLNVPIGLLAIYATQTRLTNIRGQEGRIDWPGLFTFSGALFMLVFALVRGNDQGWSSALILTLLIGSAALLAIFFAVERRRDHPMLDLGLFRNPTFVGASIVAFALSDSLFALFLYQTLWIQGILGFTPLQAGVRFLPITLMSFVVSPIGGRLSARVPLRLLMGGGLGLVGVGLLLMGSLDANSRWTALLPGFIVAGVGVGLVNPSLASAAVGVVDSPQSGMASGINSTFRQVGIATGVAGLGAVFQHVVRTHVYAAPVARVLGAHAGQFANAVSSGALGPALSRVPPSARASLHHLAAASFTAALNDVLVIGGLLALAGAGLGLVLVRGQDLVGAEPGPAIEDRERATAGATPGATAGTTPGLTPLVARPIHPSRADGRPRRREPRGSPVWGLVQHVEYEEPGLIASAAARRGIALEVHCTYAGDALPELDRLAGLVVMGGPMGVGDTEQHPHLAGEQDLLARAVRAGLPVLGVCLGAQLLARALGAGVEPGPEPELGLGAVALTSEGRVDPVLGPAGPLVPVLHWHADTFEIPDGAVRLAASRDYPNQAFRMGRLAYAFQFHVELDRGLAAQIRPHLPRGVAIPEPGRAAVERAGAGILDRFFRLAADARPRLAPAAGRGMGSG
ncbi:MAG TPA: DHA2 family efflux MFS transporter permease subunit [Solirubrobacteraceae bacterium]|nr:DHA2 family efflux MFS transporter permease subunit [Solirubrobacteraceae bacterium]